MEKSIAQKHEFSCGIAVVAFVLGISYEEVAALLSIKKANSVGFYCKDLVGVLKEFRADYEYKYLKPKIKREIYKRGTIVFIKRSKDFPTGHYLARGKSCWMDPWINFKSDKDIKNARAGFRKRLPGKPIYTLFPKMG